MALHARVPSTPNSSHLHGDVSTVEFVNSTWFYIQRHEFSLAKRDLYNI